MENKTAYIGHILSLLFLVVTFSASGQSIVSNQGWMDLNLKWKIAPTIKVGGDIGYRTNFNLYDFHTVLVRPTIWWRVSPAVSLSGSISTFHTFNKEVTDLNEFRMAQQITIKWPKLGNFKLNHRIRFEERFYSIDPVQENSTRGRYRIAFGPPDFYIADMRRRFYALVSWEAFVPISQSFESIIGESNRWEFSLGKHLTHRFKMDLHYIMETVRIVALDYDLSKHIWRLRIHYMID